MNDEKRDAEIQFHYSALMVYGELPVETLDRLLITDVQVILERVINPLFRHMDEWDREQHLKPGD